ncbi:hypothetical protein ABIG04_010008 [Bradyrhizobium japonicum]
MPTLRARFAIEAARAIPEFGSRPIQRFACHCSSWSAMPISAGAGAARVPVSLASDDLAAGNLVRWGDVEGPSIALWAPYPSRRLLSAPGVSVILDFLKEGIPKGTSEELVGVAPTRQPEMADKLSLFSLSVPELTPFATKAYQSTEKLQLLSLRTITGILFQRCLCSRQQTFTKQESTRQAEVDLHRREHQFHHPFC